MPLTEIAIKNAKPEEKRYSLADSNGLYLEIMPSGSKYWRFRYSFRNKPGRLTFGEYPLVSLKEAREMRDEARTKRTKGENPAKNYKTPTTFGELFEDFKNTKLKPLSAVYVASYEERVKNHILPHHKNTPVREIAPNDILQVARGLEAVGKYEQARRVKQIYGQVIRYGVAIGACEHDPTYALKGALSPKNPTHYSTITNPDEVGAFMRVISGYGSAIVRNALLLHAYTFVRPGELRHAEWAEIDLKAGTWKIPAAKMKMRRIHVVPLSRQALEVLDFVKRLTGSGQYVFPNARTRTRPMGEAAELAAIRSLGYTTEQMVPHGFRGMASTLLHENGWASDYIEKQLAHEVGNSVSQAYNHAEYLDKRIEMMQWWADYLDGLRDKNN